MNNSDQPFFPNNRVYAMQQTSIQHQPHRPIQGQHLVGLSANAPEFVPQQKLPEGGNNFVNVNGHHQQFHQNHHQNSHHQPQHYVQHQQPHHDFRNLPNLMNNMSVQEQQQYHHHQQQQHQHHNHNNRNQNHYRGKGGGSVNSRFNYNNHHPSTNNHHHHRSNKLTDSSQAATAGTGVANGASPTPPAAPANSAEPIPSEEETMAINFIETVIHNLIEDPGSYDEIATKVVNVFENFHNNEFVLSNVMEIIFKRSIEEQNFRYMGAKLYCLLDMLEPSPQSLFRTLLSLKLDYHQTELLEYMQNEQIKVRGTALFLAELYMQLRNDGARLKIIAESIVLTIKQLLKKCTPENIKCICMALKLSGYDLEFDYPKDMQFIITLLSDKANSMDVSTSRVLENVLNLQKAKWGRHADNQTNNGASGTSATSSPMHQLDLRASDEPVFYGPDGQILTDEESSFLTSNMGPSDDDHLQVGDFDDDLVQDYPVAEMDEEAEKAFEDFLKCLEFK